MSTSLLLLLIVACEIAFWVFLLLGLCTRYLWRAPALSTALLYAVPMIDVVLLIAVVLDLRSGASATFAHGLSAAYIGFTVAFGRPTLAWADRRFAYHFADGPRPEAGPSYGRALLVDELKWFARCLLAVAVTIALAELAIVAVGDAERTAAFQVWTQLPLITAFFWFVFGPLWSLLFLRSPPRGG